MNSQTVTWVKVIIHLISWFFVAQLVLAVIGDRLGGDPVQGILHFTGLASLNTLFVVLLVTPLVRWTRFGALMRVRRVIGLYCFFWAVLHVISFIWLDLRFDWPLLLGEIYQRPYLTVGMLAWLILLVLSLTSTQNMQRRLGKNWQKVHNWVYLVTLLAPIHYYWSVKSEILSPLLYLAMAVLLLLLRYKSIKSRLFKKWT